MYAQWLIDRTSQVSLHAISNGLFPQLREDEALVEGAYTFVAFRRLGIMAEGMRQLLVKAEAVDGAARCFTYVASANVPSLRGCANAGFELDHIRITQQRVGRRRVRHQAPDANAPRQVAGGDAGHVRACGLIVGRGQSISVTGSAA
jgi:hypothetical protein